MNVLRYHAQISNFHRKNQITIRIEKYELELSTFGIILHLQWSKLQRALTSLIGI